MSTAHADLIDPVQMQRRIVKISRIFTRERAPENRYCVIERYIDGRACHVSKGRAILNLIRASFYTTTHPVRRWIRGYVFYEPSHAASAIESSLWSTQHFDTC